MNELLDYFKKNISISSEIENELKKIIISSGLELKGLKGLNVGALASDEEKPYDNRVCHFGWITCP